MEKEECPIAIGSATDRYCVRYSIKRNPMEVFMLTQAHSEIVSFDTADHRKSWIDWHSEHTEGFVVLREWEDRPPLIEDEQKKLAEQARENARLAKLRYDKYKRHRTKWDAIAVSRYFDSKKS